VWPLGPIREVNSPGETCATPAYLEDNLRLKELGFEMGYHNATRHTVVREETQRGLDLFRGYFGEDPHTMSNHYNDEAIYWGAGRVGGWVKAVYNMPNLVRNRNDYAGHVPGSPLFWGDLCQERLRYCRNFVFSSVNTLAACPWMPYHDPARPFVRNWYASSEGANMFSFTKMLSPANQDQLEQEGGACIMYTHFGHYFVEKGQLAQPFRELMTRLSKRNGWFVPVSTVLDHIAAARGPLTITDSDRRRLERRWLFEKMFRGTS
jgi:hypothetical protein